MFGKAIHAFVDLMVEFSKKQDRDNRDELLDRVRCCLWYCQRHCCDCLRLGFFIISGVYSFVDKICTNDCKTCTVPN